MLLNNNNTNYSNIDAINIVHIYFSIFIILSLFGIISNIFVVLILKYSKNTNKRFFKLLIIGVITNLISNTNDSLLSLSFFWSDNNSFDLKNSIHFDSFLFINYYSYGFLVIRSITHVYGTGNDILLVLERYSFSFSI